MTEESLLCDASFSYRALPELLRLALDIESEDQSLANSRLSNTDPPSLQKTKEQLRNSPLLSPSDFFSSVASRLLTLSQSAITSWDNDEINFKRATISDLYELNPTKTIAYVEESDDPSLQVALGRIFEVSGDRAEALKWFKKAGDGSELVRLGDNSDNSSPALIARAMLAEESGDLYKAADLYRTAGCHREVVRLLIRVLQSPNHEKLTDILSELFDSAKDPWSLSAAGSALESLEDFDRAALCHSKASNHIRAIRIAIREKMDERLESVLEAAAVAVRSKADSTLLHSAYMQGIKQLVVSGQVRPAVRLLCCAGFYQQGLKLCARFDVPMDEDVADFFTGGTVDASSTDRVAILHELAQIMRNQERYQSACKRFVQAGDKLAAIECLIDSKDQERVLAFAIAARDDEVSIRVADWLMKKGVKHEIHGKLDIILGRLRDSDRSVSLKRWMDELREKGKDAIDQDNEVQEES